MAFQEIRVKSVEELLGWFVLARSLDHATVPFDDVMARTLGFEDLTARVRYEAQLTAFKMASSWLPKELGAAFTTSEGRRRVFLAGRQPLQFPDDGTHELLVSSWTEAVKLTTLADAFGLAERQDIRVATVRLPFDKWPEDREKVLWDAVVDTTGPYSDCIELMDVFGRVRSKVKVTYS